jgi:hypothetical protein
LTRGEKKLDIGKWASGGGRKKGKNKTPPEPPFPPFSPPLQKKVKTLASYTSFTADYRPVNELSATRTSTSHAFLEILGSAVVGIVDRSEIDAWVKRRFECLMRIFGLCRPRD